MKKEKNEIDLFKRCAEYPSRTVMTGREKDGIWVLKLLHEIVLIYFLTAQSEAKINISPELKIKNKKSVEKNSNSSSYSKAEQVKFLVSVV